MDHCGGVPTAEEFQFLQDHFGFLLKHGVMILEKGVSIYDRPPGRTGKGNGFGLTRTTWGHGYCRKLYFPKSLPKFFGENMVLGRRLGSVTNRGENWEDFNLVANSMSATWRARRKTAYMFAVRRTSFLWRWPCVVAIKYECRMEGSQEDSVDVYCAEVKISLEIAMRGHYQGKICHWDIDLIEVLPPPVSKRCMRELVGLLLLEGRNAGRSNAPTGKRRSLCLVASSDEETESDEAGLHPCKAHRTVSVARLLGGIWDIIGSQFVVPKLREVVVPSSPRDSLQREKPSMINKAGTLSHSPYFEAYASSWAINRDSLMSEDTTA
ncbi:unnamed protein product [Lactuca saligna]|uniref:Uncharacterized protein n=1 Tax=Lactuca saligna TaxID=75948 RepID=A0AA35ZT97_LACSI|nr:unnamed protein product [Lactuca saligna]